MHAGKARPQLTSFAGVQVPEKSVVLLVKFAPTLAFYTWHCLQNLPAELDSALLSKRASATDQPAALAYGCAEALGASPGTMACLMILSPNELLPESILPVTEAAVFFQDPINKSKLRPKVTVCTSFLTTLLQPDACKDNFRQSFNPGLHPGSLFAAATKADCKDAASSAPHSNRTGSPDMSAEMNASTDQAQNAAYDRLLGHLCAAILTTKLLLLAQPVQHVTSQEKRHGSLLRITNKVLEEMQAAGNQIIAAPVVMPALYVHKAEQCTRSLMCHVKALMEYSAKHVPQEGPLWHLLSTAKQALKCILFSSALPRDAALLDFSCQRNQLSTLYM